MDLLGQALVGLTSLAAGSAGAAPLALEPAHRAAQPRLWYSIGSQIGGAVAGGLPRQPRRATGLCAGGAISGASCPWRPSARRALKASLAHLAVNLLALLTFLAVTYVVLRYTAISILGRRVAGDILIAIACVRGATALSKAYLAPENARRRLAAMDDAAALEAQRWVAALFGLGDLRLLRVWRQRAGSGCHGPCTPS